MPRAGRQRHPAKLALLFGTARGSPATIARCDHTVRIPMAHGVDSLNVAASSAVAFYAFRQLSQLGR
ncbi:MAG: TrmH family RNA methyltransferase [Coriobacteriaceae bacterium]